MAAALSRSWSFFSGSQRGANKQSVNEDQSGVPSSRVNLQERFMGGGGSWRTGPLPPLPTDAQGNEEQHTEKPSQPRCNKQPPCQNCTCSDDDNSACQDTQQQASYPKLQWDHVASLGAQPTKPNNATQHRYSLRPLRSLPSGVAPLWNNLQDNVKQLKPQTSKIFHEGGKKMNRALQGVRTSISSLSQIFRSSTRRRYKLDGSTPTRTPRRTPRRTPGKLYSPFNMSTPPTPYSYKATKRLQNNAPKRNIQGKENPGLVRTPKHCPQWCQFNSPSRSLRRDTAAITQGIRELDTVTSGILEKEKGKWTQFR